MSDETTSEENEEEALEEDVEGGGEVEDGKVVIGGNEMSTDEATELVDRGKEFKEITEKYPDIDFRELPRSFTQTRQELADIKKREEQGPENVEPGDLERKKQIETFFEDPLVQKKIDERLATKEKDFREDLEFKKIIESLEVEFDGTDGRPKFDKMKVLEYGTTNQVYNPKAAYKQMHEKELDEWKIKQKLEKKRPTTYFEKRRGTGSKQPETKTAGTFKEATDNALAQEE